jgi:hypothetical protein
VLLLLLLLLQSMGINEGPYKFRLVLFWTISGLVVFDVKTCAAAAAVGTAAAAAAAAVHGHQ